MIELKKAVDVVNASHKLITIYGQGGIGKTTFATNNSNAPKTLLISLENDGGLVAIKTLAPEIQNNIYTYDVDISVGSPVGAVGAVIDEIAKMDFDVIIFDPFTNIRMKHATFLSNSAYGGKMEFQLWGDVKRHMDALFDKILALKNNSHVIIIAHEEIKQNEDTFTGSKSMMIQPAVGNAVVEKFQQYSDEIIRVTKDEHGRKFDFGSNPNITTKSRTWGGASPEQLLIDGDALNINMLLN